MAEPTEDRVVTALRGLADAEAVPDRPDVADVVAGRVARRRRRRQARRGAGLAAVAALALVVGIVAVVDGDDDGTDLDVRAPSTTTTAPSSTTVPTTVPDGPAEPLPAGFSLLPPPPLSPRTGAVVAEVEGRVVVWGGEIEGASLGRPELGEETFADGAVYDPGTQRWTVLPPGPLPGAPNPAQWTVDGDRLVIARSTQVAAWDVGDGEWIELPDLRRSVDELVALDGTLVALGPGATVLRPGATAWEEADAPPLALDAPAYRWTAVAADGEVIVVIIGPLAVEQPQLWAASLDPATGRWDELPPVPTTAGFAEQVLDAAWTGEEVVAVGYGMSAAAYRPSTGTWRTLPSLPVIFNEGIPRVLAVGGTVVVERLPAVAVLDGHRWLPSPWPAGFPCCTLAAGSGGRVWGAGIPPTGPEGATPSTTSASLGIIDVPTLVDPPTALLGSVRLDLGSDALRDVRLDDAGALTASGVTAEVALSGTSTCTVRVAFTAEPTGDGGAQAPVTVTDRGQTPAGAAVEGVVATSYDATSGYRFAVTCPAMVDADDLASRLSPNPSPSG